MAETSNQEKLEEFLLDEKPKVMDNNRGRCWNPFGRNRNGEGGIDYLSIIGAFFVQFIVLGIMNNAGSLKSHWEKEFGISATLASLPGTLNYGFMFLSGIFATALEKRIGFANMHCVGCLVCSLALFCGSYSPSFNYVIVSYGALFGIGASFAFFSSIYVQLYYFKSRIAITSGIVSSGSGFGTMSLSILLNKLFLIIGWRSTVYFFSAGMIGAILISLLYRTADFRNPKYGTFGRLFASTSSQVVNKSDRNACISCMASIVNFSALKSVRFVIFALACLIFMLGYLIPFMYIKDFAVTTGVDSLHALKFVGYMSIASLFGKISIGNLTMIPSFKPLYIFQACLLLMGVSSVCSRFCRSLVHFIVYSIIFGFFEGGYVALTSVVVVDILGERESPSGLGLLYALKSIPIVASAPLAGILFNKFGSFSIMIVFSGALCILASFLLSSIAFISSNNDIPIVNNIDDEFSEKPNVIDDVSTEIEVNKYKQDI